MGRKKSLRLCKQGKLFINMGRKKSLRLCEQGQAFLKYGAKDGARTHNNRNHNPGLCQLSYFRREQKI